MKTVHSKDKQFGFGQSRLGVIFTACLMIIGVAFSGLSLLDSSKAQGSKMLATGSGHIYLGCMTCDKGDYRNFAFSAIKDREGDVNGQAQLNNRNVPVEDHVEVQCLNISGNIAIVSGVIKKSNSKIDPTAEFPEGTPVIFSVQDNGEGSNAPMRDMISLEFQTADPQDCMKPGAPPPTIPIEHGNIQVHVK